MQASLSFLKSPGNVELKLPVIDTWLLCGQLGSNEIFLASVIPENIFNTSIFIISCSVNLMIKQKQNQSFFYNNFKDIAEQRRYLLMSFGASPTKGSQKTSAASGSGQNKTAGTSNMTNMTAGAGKSSGTANSSKK